MAATYEVKQKLLDFLRPRVEAGDVLLLGVSGGADSLALATAASAIAAELTVTFVPVIVDHQLQTGSADVALQARAACEKCGLTRVLIKAVNVVESGEGLESAARTARYEVFHQAIAETGAVAILLAHSLEDQAETVLMRLSRGSGARSIAAMASEQGVVWRPFLDVSRATLRESVVEQGLQIFDDPHNADERFLRVKVRQQLMPLMRDVLGAHVDAALARTAALARDDADALDALADAELHRRVIDGELSIDGLAQLPRAISSRCIVMWLAVRGVKQANFDHIDAVWRLATDPRVAGPIRVTGGVDVVKASGRLRT